MNRDHGPERRAEPREAAKRRKAATAALSRSMAFTSPLDAALRSSPHAHQPATNESSTAPASRAIEARWKGIAGRAEQRTDRQSRHHEEGQARPRFESAVTMNNFEFRALLSGGDAVGTGA